MGTRGVEGYSEDQVVVLRAFDAFLENPDEQVFVLAGAAGTGKTTLLGGMLDRLEERRKRWRLTAMTGRAAAIVRERTGREASTLHSYLYRFDSRASKVVDGLPRLVFAVRDPADDHADVVFVDEASMLGGGTDSEFQTLRFGRGDILADLLAFLFAALWRTPAKLVLVGDPYQLPPVGDDDSVAFASAAWDVVAGEAVGHPLRTTRVALQTVHRQVEGSAILKLATRYRTALEAAEFRTTPLPPPNDGEISTATASEPTSIEALVAGVAREPLGQAFITHTNAAARAWNRRVRSERWGDPERQICSGDILLNIRPNPMTSLENGALLIVETVSPSPLTIAHKGHDVRLRDVTLRRVEGGDPIRALVAERVLDADEPKISVDDLQVLWIDFRERHRGVKEGTPEFWEAAYRDEVLNPVVAKYGYAMTCHKAQGGQWDRVVVDFGSARFRHDSEPGFRWAYTAVTRARQRLVLLDPPRRSPFSRLTPAEPAPSVSEGTAAVRVDGDPRSRAEQAVVEWATSGGFVLERLHEAEYSVRWVVTDGAQRCEFDLFFKRDGQPSKVQPVTRGGIRSPSELVPPIDLIRRAAREPSTRPADPRIDEALRTVEQALRADGLEVAYIGQREYAIDLDVGNGEGSGILVLHARRTGVLSGPTWRRRPPASVAERVGRILTELSGD